MRQVRTFSSWVVYRKNVKGKTLVGNAVCGREEWDAMELARPGLHTLVRADIATEKEAERLARGASGDTFCSRTARKG
jgi:hypothetical protein